MLLASFRLDVSPIDWLEYAGRVIVKVKQRKEFIRTKILVESDLVAEKFLKG